MVSSIAPTCAKLIQRLLYDSVFDFPSGVQLNDFNGPEHLLEFASQYYSMGKMGDLGRLMVCDRPLPVMAQASSGKKTDLLELLLSADCEGWIVKDSVYQGVNSLLLCRAFHPEEETIFAEWSVAYYAAVNAGRAKKTDFFFAASTGIDGTVIAVTRLRPVITGIPC